MLLLSWDLFQCPRTLALVSVCMRESTPIHILASCLGCHLCFHSKAAEELAMLGRRVQIGGKNLSRRAFVWCLWLVITLLSSALPTLNMVGKSVPGLLPKNKLWSFALGACVGVAQCVISSLIMPRLAERLTSKKEALTTFSSLLMSCVLPVGAIVYLDSACLGKWLELWAPCRSSADYFSLNVSPSNRLDWSGDHRPLKGPFKGGQFSTSGTSTSSSHLGG